MTDNPSPLEDLRREVTAMPPGALLPRDWLLERLSDRLAVADRPISGAVLVDLTVADLARVFGKRPSTIRGWVERDQFPGAYKLHGKEWRVPASAVEAFQDRQRARAGPGRRTKSGTRLSQWRSVRSRGSALRPETGPGAVTGRPPHGNAED